MRTLGEFEGLWGSLREFQGLMLGLTNDALSDSGLCADAGISQ